ncbi:MAG TPA: alpha/beta hydrolase [Marmoricola sp.]|nr:alpha/beta hydrolase [Marmoricola sp.]
MLHPQSQAALHASAGQPAVGSADFDLQAAREQQRALAAEQVREPVAEIHDVDADGVPCRLYRPASAGSSTDGAGVVVHLHGGGFALNDVDVHDAAARRLANRSGAAVLSVDYRRPPEHPFPAAPDDVDTVVRWLTRVGSSYRLDTERVVVHGDSAGANLALVAALRNPGRFRALVLIYPFIDARMRHASYDTEVGGLDRAEASWYWEQYAARPADLDDPDFSPYDDSDRLGALPPTLVVTAEHDPLRDEGEELSARMARAGVEVVATRYLGMIHGFWRHVDAFDAAEPLTRQVAGFVDLHLRRPRGSLT